jgi:hypothetical protein
MPDHVNSYIRDRKSWSIKNILLNYFKAINLNADITREYHDGVDVPFEKLRQLNELLYICKEELNLIYKRLADPRKNKFESVEKFTPNETEMDFIYNVGLLFHKTMVARELKYMLEYYETDAEDDYFDVKSSLDDYIERLAKMFSKGISMVQPLLVNFIDDAVVMSYFLEHERYVRSVLGETGDNIFNEIEKAHASNDLYSKVALYFIESGWIDRAKKVLYHALQVYPNDERVRNLLIQCNG